MVEDNPADVFLIRRALRLAGINADLHFAADGEKATESIDLADADPDAPCFSLILLDLNLPKKRGSAVIEHMRASKKCGDTRILIVTSSDSYTDREEASRLGADGYFKKASDFSEFMKLGEIVQNMMIP